MGVRRRRERRRRVRQRAEAPEGRTDQGPGEQPLVYLDRDVPGPGRQRPRLDSSPHTDAVRELEDRRRIRAPPDDEGRHLPAHQYLFTAVLGRVHRAHALR